MPPYGSSFGASSRGPAKHGKSTPSDIAKKKMGSRTPPSKRRAKEAERKRQIYLEKVQMLREKRARVALIRERHAMLQADVETVQYQTAIEENVTAQILQQSEIGPPEKQQILEAKAQKKAIRKHSMELTKQWVKINAEGGLIFHMKEKMQNGSNELQAWQDEILRAESSYANALQQTKQHRHRAELIEAGTMKDHRCCASLEARIHRVRKGVRVVLDLFIDDDVGASEATIPFNYMPVGAPGSSRGMLQDNCQLGDEAFKVDCVREHAPTDRVRPASLAPGGGEPSIASREVIPLFNDAMSGQVCLCASVGSSRPIDEDSSLVRAAFEQRARQGTEGAQVQPFEAQATFIAYTPFGEEARRVENAQVENVQNNCMSFFRENEAVIVLHMHFSKTGGSLVVVESSSSAVGLVEAIGNIVRPPTSNAASSQAAYYKPTAETKSFGTTMESHLQQLKYARSSLVCFVGALSVNHGNARFAFKPDDANCVQIACALSSANQPVVAQSTGRHR